MTPTSVLRIANNRFEFYPNPARVYITAQKENTGSTIRIIDVSGRVLFTEKMVQPTKTVELTSIKPGMYFISLEDEGSKIAKKLTVK